MKKFYNSLFLMAALAISQCSFGQFYDGFTGTGNIGGNCTTVGATADCESNGWYTHSGTVGTIDIISGSLSYTGLQASTGDKIYLLGSSALTRDVNHPVTISGTVAYYSVLINLVDTVNLSENAFEKNYFMHFATESGNSFTANKFFARLAATATGVSTYKLGISTGSITLTSFPTDLDCGTTYLVVVKYDISASTATLWVNPTSLGTTEPTGSVTNSDAYTVSGIASICIRDGFSTVVQGGTPKMYIDEVRVGETWASVTPTPQSVNANSLMQATLYPNPAKDYIMISAEENISNVKVYDMQGRLVKEQAFAADQEIKLNVNELSNGLYNVVAYSSNGKMFISKFSK